MDLIGEAKQAIVGCYIANGTVQPNMVVMVNEISHQAVGLLQCRGFSGPDALALERTVESLELAIALRIVRLVRTWLRPVTRMNSLKSLAMNCGPLSLMIRGLASGYFSSAL